MKRELPGSQDITKTTLAVMFIAALAAGSFWILHPFLSAILWAAIIVVATWSVMLRVQAWCGGRRWIAVTVMTVALLLVFFLPFTIAVLSIFERADDIVAWVKSLSAFSIPQPPAWVTGIPFVGTHIDHRWRELSALQPEVLSSQLTPYAKSMVTWFISKAGNVGLLLLNFLFTTIIAAILYASGEKAAHGIRLVAKRLAGKMGEETVVLAARAVKGVALGVVLTALAQSVLGGIGLAVAGIPATVILTGIMFLLCVAQIGPFLVLLPSIIWLYWSGQTFWGTVLVIWSIPVLVIDNIMRPILIKKGADLPLVLIFAGVIGGLIAFGVVGLFIGPVLLAVTYTLLQSWVAAGRTVAGQDAAGRD
ncbi:MAG: AI-2E family transporter YdiK [Geobacteraceae bacterium]|nr:AI-2E family transporter YdiK [Geobacteraceae bacterium]